MLFNAPCSAGDLLDRISILEIKVERLPLEKAEHARRELWHLMPQVKEILDRRAVADCYRALKERNELLWDIEEQIRACHRENDFGALFLATAKKVAPYNDHRAKVKRQINDLVGSTLVEMKSHF